MIGNQLQAAVLVTPDQGIEANLARQVGLLELLFAHVSRIDIRTERFGSNTFDERLVVVEPVPGTVVQLGEAPCINIGDGIQPFFIAFPICLLPVQVVHDLGCVYEQLDHPTLVVAETAEVCR